MILYPAIVGWFGLDARQAGVFLGGTIHDVAQVVGAGYSVSAEVGNAAVLTKMLRVAMLLPVVMALTLAVRHRLLTTTARSGDPLLPPFLVAFVALVAIASLGLIPKPIGAALNEIARACLVVAIAAVGLKTSLLEMKKVGLRAIALLATETLVPRRPDPFGAALHLTPALTSLKDAAVHGLPNGLGERTLCDASSTGKELLWAQSSLPNSSVHSGWSSAVVGRRYSPRRFPVSG
jgi:hypothetical protein